MTILLASLSFFFSQYRLNLSTCRIAAILFLALFNAAHAFPQASTTPRTGIVSNYDRFKDETSVAVSTMLEDYMVNIPFSEMQEFILLVAGFTHQGQRLTVTPTTIRLAFQSQARKWRFDEGIEVLGIIDSSHIVFGRTSYTRKDLGAGHIEILRLDVPVLTFLKLARSKTAELRLGSKELKLERQHLAALALLADQLTDTATPRSTSTKRSAEEKIDVPLNQISQLGLSSAERASSSANSPATANKCPIKCSQLLPFRNFRLGMSTAEVIQRFQGVPPTISRQDRTGRRSISINLLRPQAELGSTGLDKLVFKFLDNRLYQIEATYSVGKEWSSRPMSEFADSISQGLGILSAWVDKTDKQFNKQFELECGEVRLDLMIDDESLVSFPSSRRMPMAMAFFTLTETATEAQLKRRQDGLLRIEQQRNEERRKEFRP